MGAREQESKEEGDNGGEKRWKKERMLLSAVILQLTMTSLFDKRDGREGKRDDISDR